MITPWIDANGTISWYIYYTQITYKTLGTISCLGSGYILQDVLRNPDKRTKSIYHRIMVGLSTMDILSSVFFFVLGSWSMPKGSWLWAAGNIITCDIASFLGGMGYMGSPLYNCSLVTYYLLQIKYNWSDQRIKVIEKWFHIVPWLITISLSGLIAVTKASGPFSGFCSIAHPYPYGCNDLSDDDCIRGTNFDAKILWTIIFTISLLCIIYVSVFMFVVYKTVRNVEINASKYNFLPRFRGLNTKKIMKRSRRVMMQGILYSLSMVIIWLIGVIFLFLGIFGGVNSMIINMTAITVGPLQGLFNLFIYLIPVFRKMLKRRRQRSKEDNKGEDNTEEANNNSNRNDTMFPLQVLSNELPAGQIKVETSDDDRVEKKKEEMLMLQHTFHLDQSKTDESNRDKDQDQPYHAFIYDIESDDDRDKDRDHAYIASINDIESDDDDDDDRVKDQDQAYIASIYDIESDSNSSCGSNDYY